MGCRFWLAHSDVGFALSSNAFRSAQMRQEATAKIDATVPNRGQKRSFEASQIRSQVFLEACVLAG